MKITQTVTVTREEYTMIKGTYADLLGMFLSKIGRTDDGKYQDLMKKFFGTEIKMDINVNSTIGKYAFMFHLTDSIELDLTLELSTAALERILKLGFAVADLAMPVAVATYEMANATDKIHAIKSANSELNELAATGTCEFKVERKPTK